MREKIMKQNQILKIIQETDVDQLGTISVQDELPESHLISQGILVDLLWERFGIRVSPERAMEMRTEVAATMITGGSTKEQRSASQLQKQESILGQQANGQINSSRILVPSQKSKIS